MRLSPAVLVFTLACLSTACKWLSYAFRLVGGRSGAVASGVKRQVSRVLLGVLGDQAMVDKLWGEESPPTSPTPSSQGIFGWLSPYKRRHAQPAAEELSVPEVQPSIEEVQDFIARINAAKSLSLPSPPPKQIGQRVAVTGFEEFSPRSAAGKLHIKAKASATANAARKRNGKSPSQSAQSLTMFRI